MIIIHNYRVRNTTLSFEISALDKCRNLGNQICWMTVLPLSSSIQKLFQNKCNYNVVCMIFLYNLDIISYISVCDNGKLILLYR